MSQVAPSSFEFTKETSKQQVVVSFDYSSGISAGFLTIPPGTFSAGCVINVSQSETPRSVQTEDSLDCRPEKKLASAAVNLDINHKCKTPFKNAIKIQFYTEVPAYIVE